MTPPESGSSEGSEANEPSEPSSGHTPARQNDPRDDDRAEVFANLDEAFAEETTFVEASGPEREPWEEEEPPPRRPLQFRLRALFTALLLTGLFSLAYIYQRAIGFLLFSIVATTFAARARGQRERLVATAFFGGAALFCGGWMMAESGRPPVALVGLVLTCIGGYVSLHGLALVIASFWE